ncbi:hypothetical protein TUBRATIS_22390 [Tubulinosema ratisbonensis]|uniref:Uncharacterized protein n=1 Tax=Tubulinosema ratisbonensis TaxID=291195 RepID=A0A437AJJ0_9MICR|nr:hypothetical protein TUBRATIS_22390 [Tubulinosema ratisbonensis]
MKAKQKTLFLFLTNKQIICYKYLLLIDLRPKLTVRHSLVHKFKSKTKNYLDKIMSNPFSVLFLEGNLKTNLQIFLSLRFLTGAYEIKENKEKNELCIDNLSSEESISLLENEKEFVLKDWDGNIFNINKEKNGFLFYDYKSKEKQNVIIGLLNKDRRKWLSLYKKDLVTCINFANFIKFDFFNFFNVSSSFLFIERKLHEIFCKKVEVKDSISEYENNYKIIIKRYSEKKEILRELFYVFENKVRIENIEKIREEMNY